MLYLDELGEFPRSTLEVLRQPLEEETVTIARAAGTHTFPARSTVKILTKAAATALSALLLTAVTATSALAALALPDASITPNATATTNAQEVCARAYAHAHRPPRNDPSWRAMVRDVRRNYHVARGTYQNYRIDHLVPIELGGAGGDERNLWAQPTAESILKDQVEDALQRAVCREHRIPLVQAQAEIARDWRHTSVGEPANLLHAYFEDQ
ncbi:MAG: hypothetical protein JWN27_3334 [Candidatus Eremiobacteraeota bacterium]|nr:hypothetical protein [Candidatus Eremiobacteraeota bacterium]